MKGKLEMVIIYSFYKYLLSLYQLLCNASIFFFEKKINMPFKELLGIGAMISYLVYAIENTEE